MAWLCRLGAGSRRTRTGDAYAPRPAPKEPDLSRLRAGKVVGYGVVGLLALLTLAVLGASVVLQGPRLGALISGALPKNRGKMEIDGVNWSLRALLDILT